MKLSSSVSGRSAPAKRKRAVKKPGVGAPSFPIVGVGASAGGLEAFIQLLENLSADTGMAFVFVQHLFSGHESALARILGGVSPMTVREAKQGLLVRRNEVYVIPPGVTMTLKDGRLRLAPRDPASSPHLSIDCFFQSLADELQERAIGVVLSGNAVDGTQGLEAIKAGGGITFAQDKSASHDSMPRSAIASGCVDHVLAPAAVARELARIAGHHYFQAGSELGAERSESSRAGAAASPASRRNRSGMEQVLDLVRKHCGVDFALYKPSTIHRRITRRMLLRRKDSLAAYLRLLSSDADELKALCGNLLINVTSFFRDPAAYEALQRLVFTKMITERREVVRIWTIGCAGGQETYSLAMAFLEVAEKYPFHAPRLQIFGTDLNEVLLNRARRGLYPKSLAHEISPARLKQFFVEDTGGYRVTKMLRDMCVFGRQDILCEPPFSRMDLITCRNVLIYIEQPAQKRVMQTMHRALRPDGFLFLGASESVGPFTDLFDTVDKKQKIFRRKSSSTSGLPLPLLTHTALAASPVRGRLALPTRNSRPEWQAQHKADRIMINQFAPPGVLVDDELNVIEFRGATESFLTSPSGKASLQLLKLARQGLVLPLRSAIEQARKKNQPVRRTQVRIDHRSSQKIALQVIPLKNLSARFFLILFETSDARPQVPAVLPPTYPPGPAGDRVVRRRNTELERELREMRDYLHSLQLQHDSAQDELQASIEEAQSANEELQTINEELETTKEELESGNEELVTINEEMAYRASELSRLNSDLHDFHVSLDTAILLLGPDLAIRRFTPLAEKLFNLIVTDVGRPIGGIKHNLQLEGFERLVGDVAGRGGIEEREVQDKSGHWYLLRIRSHLGPDKKIAGVIVVLIDIDALTRRRKPGA